MTCYVALLRAVNVGGTGKLPMSELKRLCESTGFSAVKTYIASGNVVFKSPKTAAAVKAELEDALQTYAGKPIGVVVRTSTELAGVLAQNPFSDEAANRTVAIFLDEPVPAGVLEVRGQENEKISAGVREIYGSLRRWYGGFKTADSGRSVGNGAQYEYGGEAGRHDFRPLTALRRLYYPPSRAAHLLTH